MNGYGRRGNPAACEERENEAERTAVILADEKAMGCILKRNPVQRLKKGYEKKKGFGIIQMKSVKQKVKR